jgi:hypothetical protein
VLLSLQLIATSVLLALAIVVVVYALVTGSPPLASTARVRRAILESLPRDLDGTILELGSGWGSLALPLARRYPRCTVVGYELSPIPWLVSRLCAWALGRRNLQLVRRNFLNEPLGDAALVVCYVGPATMRRLAIKLDDELTVGALVVSHTYPVPGWRPDRHLRCGDEYRTPVYLYRVARPGLHEAPAALEQRAAG